MLKKFFGADGRGKLSLKTFQEFVVELQREVGFGLSVFTYHCRRDRIVLVHCVCAPLLKRFLGYEGEVSSV
jgi:hypothetical protein